MLMFEVVSYSYSYRVTLFNELFSEESCSVIGWSEKMGFQLWSELSATVQRRSDGSAFQTTGAATEKLRWPIDVFARETNRSPRSAGVTDVTNPRLCGWLAWGRQDQYFGHSRTKTQSRYSTKSQKNLSWLCTWNSSRGKQHSGKNVRSDMLCKAIVSILFIRRGTV